MNSELHSVTSVTVEDGRVIGRDKSGQVLFELLMSRERFLELLMHPATDAGVADWGATACK